MPMPSDSEYEFFKHHGYLVLNEVFADNEKKHLLELYDRDRVESSYSWVGGSGNTQQLNNDVLITSPGMEPAMRKPRILDAVTRLLGGPVCFAQTGYRYMGPYKVEGSQDEFHHGWHRDRSHWMGHPLRTEFVHAMIYLADVDERTHCFSVSPESVGQPVLEDNEAQLARGGVVNLHGPAGTVVLCNYSTLHTATRRTTDIERKTIQSYYGLQSRPYLCDLCVVPTSLWRDHEDPQVRDFYGNLNDRSRAYAAAFDD